MVSSIKLENVTQQRYITLDQENSMFLLDNEGVDWGKVNANISSYTSIYTTGINITRVSLNSERTVKIIGWVVNDITGTIEEKKTLLSQFCNPLDEIILYVGGYKLNGVFQSSVVFSNKRKENNNIVCKFQLNLLCPRAVFEKTEPKIYQVDYIPENPYTFSIYNEGDLPVGFTLMLNHAPRFQLYNFCVTNFTTGEQFRMSKPTPEPDITKSWTGMSLELNTNPQSFGFRISQQGEIYTSLSYIDLIPDFPILVPGKNELEISSAITEEYSGTIQNDKLLILHTPYRFMLEDL